MDLLPPFAYLMNISSEISEHTKAPFLQTNDVCTSENCSTQVQLSDPTPTQNEHFPPSIASDFMGFLELTSYPQRAILEQRLGDE